MCQYNNVRNDDPENNIKHGRIKA